jgi:hypothetical protein
VSDRRQSFRDYLLEGAMIFVAVSLGFMADSLREYLADRETERAYMHAIVEDLQIDSLRMAENVSRLVFDVANADTMIIEFMAGRRTGRYPASLSMHGRGAGNSVDLVFNDRTASQLKGTGAMRLVQDSAVASALLRYWNNQERLHEIHDRFESLRMEHRKIGWRAFGDWYRPVFTRYRKQVPGLATDDPPAIADPTLVPEFINTTASLVNVTEALLRPELEAEIALGTRIRELIRQAYP